MENKAKKVGIIGGLGPASTIDYYNYIIEGYREKHGETTYPEMIIYSVNMGEIISFVENKEYEKLGEKLVSQINAMADAGAGFAAISANTPHIAWKYIEGKTKIPVISIIESACEYILEKKYKNVLVFATALTMRNGLYANVFDEKNIKYVLPNDQDIEELGNIIYPNLENNIVVPKDKLRMIEIAKKYIKEYGCDSMLLGCTEIPLMIKPGDVSVPVIDTTKVHVAKILEEIEK